MKTIVISFVAGALFTVGLALGGMTHPSKVIAFLDFTGAWDPSLAFVMGGAIAVYLPGWLLLRRRGRPLTAPRFHLPKERHVTGRLLGGSALFGIGWGLVGFCPAPGLSSLAAGSATAITFVATMVGGILLVRALDGRDPARADEAATESPAEGRAPAADAVHVAGARP